MTVNFVIDELRWIDFFDAGDVDILVDDDDDDDDDDFDLAVILLV